jgi:hypothetical protein
MCGGADSRKHRVDHAQPCDTSHDSFQERHKETGDIQLDAVPSSSAFSLASPWIPPECQQKTLSIFRARNLAGRHGII